MLVKIKVGVPIVYMYDPRNPPGETHWGTHSPQNMSVYADYYQSVS